MDNNLSKKINIVMDATILDTFEACECKMNYRHNLNRVTPTKAEALDRGDLIHIGMEAYYKALQKSLPYETAMLNLRRAVLERSSLESNLEAKEVGFLIQVLEESCDKFRYQDQNIQIIAVEQPFSYILYEDDKFRFIMIGKIDLLWSDNVYTNCPTDHKSYSRDFPLSRLANQFCNYAFAMKSNFLFVNRVGLQTSISPDKKHKRVPLSYDPIFLEQWRQNTIKRFFHYYDCAVENSWPMNTTSCTKFNRICEYTNVCETTGESNKIYKLESNFKLSEPWDVSKSLSSGNKDE